MTTLTTRTLQALIAASALALTLNVQAADAGTSASAPTASSESLGQHVDNATLTTKVKSKLLATDNLHSTHIHVKSRNGVVWLSGSVPTAAEKPLALEATRSVDGVTHVHSRLKVNAHPDKTWVDQKKAQASDAVNEHEASGTAVPDDHH